MSSNIEYNGPEEYKPLGMWQYFGYQILYSIPIIGFIFLVIHSVSSKNINRRNYARSFFCVLIIALIICAIAYATGGLATIAKDVLPSV
jgi:Ca2+/Na+ antiporter